MLSLREHSNRNVAHSHSQYPYSPQVGDIVLVHESMQPRGAWKMAKVIELIPSHDGQIRSARILLPSGNYLNRSLKLLSPIECPDRKSNGIADIPAIESEHSLTDDPVDTVDRSVVSATVPDAPTVEAVDSSQSNTGKAVRSAKLVAKKRIENLAKDT